MTQQDIPVIISIKGVQAYPESQPETMELVTEGILVPRGDQSYALTYDESELTGLGGTRTTFEVAPECITLMRTGEVNSQMVFQRGKRHLSLYETPYGALSVGVNTRKMHSTLDETGGEIEINYAIEIDHAVAGENLFQIQVREAKGATIPQ